MAKRHSWTREDINSTNGIGCVRCGVRKRFIFEVRAFGRRGSGLKAIEEMSADSGAIWQEIDPDLGGKRIPCGGRS